MFASLLITFRAVGKSYLATSCQKTYFQRKLLLIVCGICLPLLIVGCGSSSSSKHKVAANGSEQRDTQATQTPADPASETDNGTDDTSTDIANEPGIKLWLLGDSITFGMKTTPSDTQGFRVKIWDHLIAASNGKSMFPITLDEQDSLTRVFYQSLLMKSVGTVNGSMIEGDTAAITANNWHSGIPGASTPDLMCFLDAQSYVFPSGYRNSNCRESLSWFNWRFSENCQINAGASGWFNESCEINAAIKPSDRVVVPLQIGTNDVSFLSSSGEIDCSKNPIPGDTTAARLSAVVSTIFNNDNLNDPDTIVGNVRKVLLEKGVTDNHMAFLISKIPQRSILAAQDRNNFCTNYFNQILQQRYELLEPESPVFLINQGNFVVAADALHPGNKQHAMMACNLLYGYDFGDAKDFSCPILTNPATTGILAALEELLIE